MPRNAKAFLFLNCFSGAPAPLSAMALSFLSKVFPPSWIPYIKFIRKPWNFYLLQKDKFNYATDKLYTEVNTDFKKDPRFASAYRWAEKLGGPLLPKTGMEWRIYLLCWAADQVRHLPGDFVACGVFSGFCDRAIMEYIDFGKTGKKYYLMDTFQGLDPRYSSDFEIKRNHTMGYAEAQNLYDQVKETFRDFNVRIVRGAIPDTLPEADTDQICFLSIDMNAVVPEVAAIEYFWPKLVPGGIIIFDDYGFPTCEAQKAGHDAFARSVGHTIFTSPTGQGILIKQF